MKKISFDGQAVVVTGAGSGLGRSYALEIARRGGSVVVNDLGGSVKGEGACSEMADAVVEEIRSGGGKAVANYSDVASAEGGQQMIASALETFGRVDAVIANAGNFRMAKFDALSASDLMALLTVHIVGSWNVAQAAWPHMKAQGYGRLVFTASSVGLFGTQSLAAYGTAKGGIMGLMHNLSYEGAPHGILCNAIMPNAFTRMTAAVTPDDLGGNPYSAQIPETFAPEFAQGLATFLASRDCATTHGLYSSLGGRIARVFIGVTNGYQGSRKEPLSAEDIAAHWQDIRDDNLGYAIPADVTDEFRYVIEGRCQ